MQLHADMMQTLSDELVAIKEQLTAALDDYTRKKAAFRMMHVNPPKAKTPKTRLEEIDQEMFPLRTERDMEVAAGKVDRLRREKATVERDLRNEKKFEI